MPIVALLCKRNYGTALSAARLVGSGFKPTSHGAEQLPSLVLGASGPGLSNQDNFNMSLLA